VSIDNLIPVLKTQFPTATYRHPFNGFFSRKNKVSQHQKGKTILDFNEARDHRVAVASVRPYANYLHLSPDR